MELKLFFSSSFPYKSSHLLIVPYGIETIFHSAVIFDNILLIVPYGIETHQVIVRN